MKLISSKSTKILTFIAQHVYVRFDLDTFVTGQSCTHKEEVGRTYQGVDGSHRLRRYPGNEGLRGGGSRRGNLWCANLDSHGPMALAT